VLSSRPESGARRAARRAARGDGLQLATAGRRRALPGVVFTLLGTAGAWAIIGQGKSLSQLTYAVRAVGPWWLVLAAAGSGIAYLGYALLYQAVSNVRQGPRPHLRLALRMTIVVFGAAVVATGVGRLGAEYWSLRRMGEMRPLAIARVLALNVALWAVLAGLAAVAAVIALATGTFRVPEVLAVAWLAVVSSCTVLALWVSSPRHELPAVAGGGRIRRIASPVQHSLVLLRSVSSWRPLRVRGLAGALIYWVGELLVVWAALGGFGVHLGYAAFLLGYATGYASTILPLPFGGAGGVDAATVYALTLVGVPVGPALLATLVQRVLTFWLPLGVAITAVRALRRLGRDLSLVPRPEGSG
jgi:uncharacterized membrane protein YbhN (UPF0104 family)